VLLLEFELEFGGEERGGSTMMEKKYGGVGWESEWEWRL